MTKPGEPDSLAFGTSAFGMPPYREQRPTQPIFQPGHGAVGHIIGHHHRDPFTVIFGCLRRAVPALREGYRKGVAARWQEGHLGGLLCTCAFVTLVKDSAN